MTLQQALGTASCTEIWVRTGVYTPGTTPTDTFDINPGVAVYGGFAGIEISRGDRDPAANVAILSGDIDQNDTHTDGNAIDETSVDIQGSNSIHVVTMDGNSTAIGATTVLNGFTVTAGDDRGDSDGGGGLWCKASGSASASCSPTLSPATRRKLAVRCFSTDIAKLAARRP